MPLCPHVQSQRSVTAETPRARLHALGDKTNRSVMPVRGSGHKKAEQTGMGISLAATAAGLSIANDGGVAGSRIPPWQSCVRAAAFISFNAAHRVLLPSPLYQSRFFFPFQPGRSISTFVIRQTEGLAALPSKAANSNYRDSLATWIHAPRTPKQRYLGHGSHTTAKRPASCTIICKFNISIPSLRATRIDQFIVVSLGILVRVPMLTIHSPT